MTVEDSAHMMKYYQNPSESSKHGAIKALNQTFPRCKAFTPFAWTYVDFMDLRSSTKPFTTPDFYLLERSIYEGSISDRIVEIEQGKLKQIPMNFIFSKSDFSPFIIPPIYRYRPQPHLIPIHKAQLQLLSASLKSSGGVDPRNVLIRISVHGGPNEPPLKIIHSKYNPAKLVEYSESSSFYHDKNPKFIDDFVIDLPYPTPINTLIKFDVYHVHAKPSDQPMKHIGGSVFKILNNGLIQNGEFEIAVAQGSLTKDFGKILIRLDFQSTFDTSDAQMMEIRKGGETYSRVKLMSDATIVRNLVEILSLWIDAVWSGAESSLKTIEHIQAASMRVMKPMRLMKYLVVFSRYFALRQETLCIVLQQENIQLSQRSTSPIVKDDLLEFGSGAVNNTNYSNDDQNKKSPKKSKFPIPSSNSSPNQKNESNCKSATDDRIPLYQKLGKLITEYISKEKSLNKINLFLDFFFSLATKSIAVTPQPRFEGTRALFEVFSSVATAKMTDTRWQPFQSLGIFALELFDLGFADECCDAVCTMIGALMPDGASGEDLASFLEVVIRPAPLLMLLKHYDEFRRCIHGVIKASWKSDYLKPVFGCFIKCFGVYDADSAQTVAAALVPPLVSISMHALPPIQESMPFISFVSFVLANAGSKGLSAVDTTPLVKHAHFILSNVSAQAIRIPVLKTQEAPVTIGGGITVQGTPRVHTMRSKRVRMYRRNEMSEADASKAREALDYIHTGIVHFVESLAQATARVKCGGPLSVAHHIIKVSPNQQLVPVVCGMVTAMIIYFSPHIFYADSPPLAKFLVDFLAAAESYCEQGVSPQLFATVLTTIFQKDFEANGNNHRATAIAIRTLSLFTHHELVKPFLTAVINCCPNPNDALKELIRKFTDIKDNSAQLLEKGISISKQVELLTHRLILFAKAPAAQASVVDSIMFIHLNANNQSEYINALTLKASLIAENCTNTWSSLYGLEHPAELFRDACTFTDKIVTPTEVRDAIVGIPGGCDTNDFSETSFIATMYRAIVYSLENGLLEYPVTLIDAALPLLEFARQYGQASTIIGILAKVMESSSLKMDENPERFFKVRFIGSLFAEEADKSYVYHANNLVNLFEFSRNLVESYQQAYGADKVELLSSPPQPVLPDKGYIQVTFLTPLAEASEPLGRPSRATKFYYDAPFTRDGKSQGTVDTQWLRRTYITTDIALPSIVRRVSVNPEKTREVEYEPIRVAYRQIREQAMRLERACEMNDYPGIQRLLHGSLLVQVNEGPERTAEAFMDNHSPRRAKLFREFQRFLAANERGIMKHGEWIADKPEFVQLQVELELHLDALRAKVQQLQE